MKCHGRWYMSYNSNNYVEMSFGRAILEEM